MASQNGVNAPDASHTSLHTATRAMCRAVLECDNSKGQPGQPWLQTRDALIVVTALLK